MIIEAMKQALEALEADEQDMVADKDGHMVFRVDAAITALRQAIEQAEQAQPVAWVRRHPDGALTAEFLEHAVIEPARKKSGAWVPLYTAPPPRQRSVQPLTDEQISDLWCKVSNTDFVTADTHEFARAIEAAHGIKE